MSVRPITVGEETKAYGHPFVNILSIFGGTQGLLIYLNRTRIPLRANWFPNGQGRGLFLTLVLGGYLTGGFVAMGAFSDWNIVRLAQQHKRDRDLNVEA